MTFAATSSEPQVVGSERVLARPFGVGLAFGAGACLTSGVAATLSGEARVAIELITVAVVGAALAAVFAFSRLHADRSVRTVVAMAKLVVAWTGLTLMGFMAMLVVGPFDSAIDALFETVSATTTTGFTSIAEPETLPNGVKMLRVSLQWFAGLGVLIGGMGILRVAVAGVELLPKRQLTRREQIASETQEALRNVTAAYAFLTSSLIVGYWITGMSFFDAMSYALSTASTGGMANHAASIGHFDSAAIEAIATAGMIAAGGNLVIVWWAFRGAFRPVLRSTELRLYASLLALGTLTTWIIGADQTFRAAIFDMASMLSTTGLRSTNWADGGGYVEATLFIAAGIGAMAGSVGSGFRIARVARVALEVRRSLRRLIHPRQVEVIRMDDHPVEEASLDKTYGYLWLHLMTLGAIAAMLNVPDSDVVEVLTLALSAVSNVGVEVAGDTVTNTVDLNWWSSLVAMSGMVLGRLSIYTVMLTVVAAVRWLARFAPRVEAGQGT